jgi:hypothetical protein
VRSPEHGLPSKQEPVVEGAELAIGAGAVVLVASGVDSVVGATYSEVEVVGVGTGAALSSVEEVVGAT